MALFDIISLNTIFLLFVLSLIYRFAKFIYNNFIRKRIHIIQRYGEGSWALVTGATDGIGKSLVFQLAQEGLNIILVSRSQEKLNKVEKEVNEKFKSIKTTTIAFDFGQKTQISDYTSTFSKLTEKYDISLLVNNVGNMYNSLLSNQSLEDCYNGMVVNIFPQTLLTKIFTPYLQQRKNRSGVIDLSSFVTLFPIPGYAIYSATKSYNRFLSKALWAEFEDRNIDFLCVKPGKVDTPLAKIKADGFIALTSDQCATGILNDLGYESETFGHWIHKIHGFVLGLIPISLIQKGEMKKQLDKLKKD
jgi:17beta-estradiol 17-dehydrogenase / very-long-chain 3-oxoacyl-CoA reductase